MFLSNPSNELAEMPSNGLITLPVLMMKVCWSEGSVNAYSTINGWGILEETGKLMEVVNDLGSTLFRYGWGI